MRKNRRAFLSILIGERKITLLSGIDDNRFELDEISLVLKNHFQIQYTSDRFRLENSSLKYCFIQKIKNSIKFIEMSPNMTKYLKSCSIKNLLNIQKIEPKQKNVSKQLRIPLIFYKENTKESFILITKSKTKFYELRRFINRLNPKGEISNDKPKWIDYVKNVDNQLSATESNIKFENLETFDKPSSSSDSFGIKKQFIDQTIYVENTNSNGSEIPPENGTDQ